MGRRLATDEPDLRQWTIMAPVWILLLGVVVVMVCVLGLRLHAFLALVLAALTVAAATPRSIRIEVARQKAEDAISSEQRQTGRPLSAEARMRRIDAAVQAASRQTIGDGVTAAFGSTCANIGILIAMASIVGKCLLDSGAADRIVRSALAWFGQARASVAFLASGFTLGIPVFFDTVFYLMIPLGKALRVRTGRDYLLYVLSITGGATMAHSLVPPTPGPLFVASALNVDLGLMMLGGCGVGLFTVLFCYFYASLVNRRCNLPLRATADLSLDELEKLARRSDAELPPLWLALAPIALPVILIAGHTGLEMWSSSQPAAATVPGWQTGVRSAARQLGNPTVALAIAAAIAVVTLVWQRRTSRQELADSVQRALLSAGEIILITAAGGAFGGMLQQTGIAAWIQQHSAIMAGQGVRPELVYIPLAFVVTMLIRTAQGSATVAMITAVGVLAPLAASGQTGCHPLFVALAIGCGSKPIAWMNDSGFWVMCKMSGMTVGETLKYITPMTSLMGLVGLAATLAWALLWPLSD